MPANREDVIAAAREIESLISTDKIAGSSDGFVSLPEMAASGMARTVSPRLLGDEDDRLCRIEIIMPKMSEDIWVASYVDLADVSRSQAVRWFLTDQLSGLWQTP